MSDKRYILQKDLPDAKAGAKYHPTTDGETYVCYDNLGKWSVAYSAKTVENNLDWFLPEQAEWGEEIKKCNESPFYFATKYLTINGEPFTTRLNEKEFNEQFYQQSKQPIKPDRRIKVSIEDWSADMMGVVMYFTDKISQEQKPLIKQTLEAALNNDLAYSIGRLVEELEKDKSEGSYYHSWQANIAVAFQDVYREEFGDSQKMRMFIHEISNTAAKRFLDLLCYHPVPETSINSLNTNTKR